MVTLKIAPREDAGFCRFLLAAPAVVFVPAVFVPVAFALTDASVAVFAVDAAASAFFAHDLPAVEPLARVPALAAAPPASVPVPAGSSAHASGSIAAVRLLPVFGFARVSGSWDGVFPVLGKPLPPKPRLPAAGPLLSSKVPTNPRCLSPIPCATNSVADAAV